MRLAGLGELGLVSRWAFITETRLDKTTEEKTEQTSCDIG